MKTFLIAITFAFALTSAFAEANPASQPPKTKQICKVKDGKKTCKTIKVRKKLDGSPVPTK